MTKSMLRRLSDRIRRDFWYLVRKRNLSVHGVPVYVPPTIPWDIFKQIIRGTYEAAENRLIERHLDSLTPVVELGGSIGIISAVIRRKLSPDTPMTVVEANPNIVGLCERNVRMAAGPVRVVNAAVSYGPDKVTFDASDDYLSGKIARDGTSGSIRVDTVTLEDVCDGLDRFTLVMDIEGAEYDVFRNGTEALQHCRLAIVEIHPDAEQAEADFFALAAMHGFEVIDREADVIVLARREDGSGHSKVPRDTAT